MIVGDRVSEQIVEIIQINLARRHLAAIEVHQDAQQREVVYAFQEPAVIKGTIAHIPNQARSVCATNGRPLAAVVSVADRHACMGLPYFTNPKVATMMIGSGPSAFVLVSAYFPPSEAMSPILQVLETICHANSDRVIICADTNAWSKAWGSTRTDARGRIIAQFCLSMGLTIVNDPASPPTFNGPRGSSAIDLTMVSDRLLSRISKWRVAHNTCSDHATISFEVRDTVIHRSTHPRRRFAEKNADWKGFASALEIATAGLPPLSLFSEITDNSLLDKRAAQVQECFAQAASKTLKSSSKNNARRSKPWWSTDIKVARQSVNKCRRDCQRSPPGHIKTLQWEIYKILKRKLKAKIRAAKRASWRDFVQDQSRNGPWSLAYHIAKTSKTPRPADLAFPSVTGYPSDLEQSHLNLLAGMYGEDDPTRDTIEQRVVRNLSDAPPGTPCYPNWDIHDLDLAISSLNRKGAPATDGISPAMIFNAGPECRRSILELANAALDRGHFPDLWKVADVLTFPKKGPRDMALPASYRPICLLPCLGKLLETLIKHAMHPFVMKNVSPRQFGGVKGRSTEDAIQALLRECSDPSSKYSIAVFLDIAGAYDNAWWPAILRALHRIDAPSNLYSVIRSYLSERSARIMGDQSGHAITKGCPQGSVIGPLLWTTMIDGLLVELESKGLFAVAYVDDIAVVVHGSSRARVLAEACRAVGAVSEWTTAVRLKVAEHKSAALVMKGSFDQRHPPIIRTPTGRISFPESVTYLGVALGPSLSVSPHVDAIRSKVHCMASVLARMSSTTWGLKFPNMLKIYNACAKAIVWYAIAGWGPYAKKGHLAALRTIQRNLLIRCTRAYRTVSHEALQVIAGAPPIDLEFSATLAARRYCKGLDVTPFCPIELLRRLQEVDPQGVSTKIKVRKITMEYIAEAWQRIWDASANGRTTHGFLPSVSARMRFPWLSPNHLTSQFLSGHGNFAWYLHKYQRSEVTRCPCDQADERAEHVLLQCPLYDAIRFDLMRRMYDYSPSLPNFVETEEGYKALCRFAVKWHNIKGGVGRFEDE